MDIAIAIFAKNPDLSPVKTRLASDIGEANAIAFYRLCLQAVQQLVLELVAASSHSITPYWALAEQQSCGLPAWQSFDTLWTGEGGLGERLHQVYTRLLAKHDGVILIGTDSPALPLPFLEEAMDLLGADKGRVVIGPAMDGGFYLFAGCRVIEKPVWICTPYSRDNTLQVLEQQLHRHDIATVSLPWHFDVDTKNDLAMLQEFLHKPGANLAVLHKLEKFNDKQWR